MWVQFQMEAVSFLLEPFKTTQCQFCTEMSDLCYLQKPRFYYLQNLRQKKFRTVLSRCLEVSPKLKVLKNPFWCWLKIIVYLTPFFKKEQTSLESQTNYCFLHMWVKKPSGYFKGLNLDNIYATNLKPTFIDNLFLSHPFYYPAFTALQGIGPCFMTDNRYWSPKHQ